MRKKLILSLITALTFQQAIHSSNTADSVKIPLTYTLLIHEGYLLPTWSFVRGKFKTEGPDFCQFKDLSLMVLKQTIGEKPIEQLFHYPRYGVGLYTGTFFKYNYLTHPIGAFGIFQAPLLEYKGLSLNYSLLLGLTGNWNHYDPSHGNFNTTLASDFTSHVGFGLFLEYQIRPRWEAGLGFSFTHFSNGAMQIPNFGINMLAPQVRLSYLTQNTRATRIKRSLPPYAKNTYLDLALYGGEKQLPYPECDLDTAHRFFGFHYPQFGLTAVLNRRVGYAVALGMGVHLGYDSSKNSRYTTVNGETQADLSFNAQNLYLGLVPSFELTFDKVAFVLQPCYMLLKHETSFKKPNFFGKFGLKFNMMDEVYAGVQLHTFKLHADYIECSLGYRLPLTRRSN